MWRAGGPTCAPFVFVRVVGSAEQLCGFYVQARSQGLDGQKLVMKGTYVPVHLSRDETQWREFGVRLDAGLLRRIHGDSPLIEASLKFSQRHGLILDVHTCTAT
jgi:hypothetical protein